MINELPLSILKNTLSFLKFKEVQNFPNEMKIYWLREVTQCGSGLLYSDFDRNDVFEIFLLSHSYQFHLKNEEFVIRDLKGGVAIFVKVSSSLPVRGFSVKLKMNECYRNNEMFWSLELGKRLHDKVTAWLYLTSCYDFEYGMVEGGLNKFSLEFSSESDCDVSRVAVVPVYLCDQMKCYLDRDFLSIAQSSQSDTYDGWSNI
eukprot:GDKJ01009258.1.p1 GENE.GDKJ01009258.1~~GDKJ01009258.1.p1  ORF type:complete len:212 (-),score=18.40 GDKJ01009258.1:32-640(-)